MNISAAAKTAGLPVKTVRYHADIGLVSAPERTDSGYRTYDDSAARKLMFVRRAREFGFLIDECCGLLSLHEDQNRSSADVKRIATKHRELQSLHDGLAHLVDTCKGDGRPDCPIINGLETGGPARDRTHSRVSLCR